ncbi:hypothetical protein PMAYCL1PPCAC_00659 [Pristionchus mayeri]|uniref:Uncharacterized protein n=1 Tax=Pristionchus mayeri TaxID=1317129 RepID=A0AAN4YZ36_9BILA|nr:hypothetical protein PMAYCL1PPCAC_00659 [Pristionchus mayeri]
MAERQAPPPQHDKFANHLRYAQREGNDMTMIVAVSFLLLVIALIIARLVKWNRDESAAARRTAALQAMNARGSALHSHLLRELAAGRRRAPEENVRRRRANYRVEDEGDFVLDGEDFMDEGIDEG